MDIKQLGGKTWRVGSIVLLLVGLVAAVYLVQTKQIFKSKAAMIYDTLPGEVELSRGFDITDANGRPLKCQNENGRFVCYTPTRDVYMNVNREELGKALQ